MENAENIPKPETDSVKVSEMRSGANWFFWIAIFSVINFSVVAYFGISDSLVGLGATRYVDALVSRMILEGGSPNLWWAGVVFNILIAALFAMFGYFARRGSDIAFIVGMFLYLMDALLVLAYRDSVTSIMYLFAFAFHMLALFFMFRGLLASRRRLDPSV